MELRTLWTKKSLAALACLVGLSQGLVRGQATNSADVTGTVTDPSGAVVPDVTVTVTDIDKNTEKTYTTNASGLFDTGPLIPEDRYVILFKKQGLATLQRGPMTLGIGVTGLNVQLTISQSSQQIVVQDQAAPLLETATAEISSTLSVQTLTELPQVGTPDWQEFIILLPGTSGTPQNGNQTSNPGMGGVSANGSMPFSTALLDGATTTSPMSDNVVNTPIFDSIAEVKISDSLFSAQYGTGGILYNQISKGGSNQFHGMGYDYFRNTALNAANFQFGLAGVTTPIHYNAFGGNFGGPVIKDKVFAFFAIENVVNHGGGGLTFTSVPTLPWRSGNFAGASPIYDPTTQVVNSSGVVTRQPFAGNQIPAAMIDPVARALQNTYPLPNVAGTLASGVATNNYAYILPSSSPLRKYFGRFDADITKNNRITGSASWDDAPGITLSPICPINCLNRDIFNTNNQISDYWSISPHTINEFRVGFMGEYDLLTPQTLGQGWPAKLGLSMAKADLFPTINVTGMYSLAPNTNANYKENLFDISDVLTLIRGRHVLHFGGDMIIERADSTAWGNINSATLGFTGVYTAGSNTGALANGSGAPYADFLLGYARSWSASVSPEYGGRLKNPSVFVEDEFKVTPRLNLNLGLRWMGTTGWSDEYGNERSFDPTIINPTTNAPGAMWYGVTHANGRTTLQQGQFNNWQPRLGFAYQLGTKMTLRGGFGMYTFPWNVDTYASAGLGNAFTTSGNQTDSTNNVSPVVTLSSDGNTNFQGTKGSAINSLYLRSPLTPQGYNGQAVGFVQYHSPVPLLKSWNFSVQRQVSNSMLAEVSYVGSRGTNLPFLTDLNQVPAQYLSPNDAAFRPYPEFQGLAGVNTAGVSNYNALQASITRRMSNGLDFNFNYTWSHMLSNQDSSGWGSKQGNQPYQSAYYPGINYGNSNFDIRHMFKGRAIYNLPFGRGRNYMNNNAALDAVFGGWALTGTIVVQTGNPFTPYMQTNNSYSLSTNNLQYPNVIGDPTRSNPTIASWFNVSALAAPAPGTFGNMGRNVIFGPGLTAVNMALRKTFAIKERVRLDFSANSTNVLNHPSFSQPDLLIGPGHIGSITGTTVGGRQIELVGKIRF